MIGALRRVLLQRLLLLPLILPLLPRKIRNVLRSIAALYRLVTLRRSHREETNRERSYRRIILRLTLQLIRSRLALLVLQSSILEERRIEAFTMDRIRLIYVRVLPRYRYRLYRLALSCPLDLLSNLPHPFSSLTVAIGRQRLRYRQT